MNAIRMPFTRGCALALAALATAACEHGIGLDTTAVGSVQMSMFRSTDTAMAGDTSSGGTSVQPDTVASLKVTVTAIEFLRAGAADTSDGSSAWTRVSLAAPVQIDLMALPTDTTSALVIASGSVAAGSYSRVRLFVTNPRITFKGGLQFGVGVALLGGVEYQVTIPSVAQTGIKTTASFTVTATANGGTTEDVNLSFNQASTLANVTVTGTGQVILAPVIHCESSN